MLYPRSEFVRWMLCLGFVSGLLACGARTGLNVPPFEASTADIPRDEPLRDVQDVADIPEASDVADAVDVPPMPLCAPGDVRACYSGPAATRNVGTCRDGEETCTFGPDGAIGWGPCRNAVLPAAPQCDGLDHECRGMLPVCPIEVRCSAAVRIRSGSPTTLSATVTSAARVLTTTWTVRSAPSGATTDLTTPNLSTTGFSANATGAYVIEFTATNDRGRSATCSVPVTVSETYRGTEFWAVSTANSQLRTGDRFHFAIAVGNPNATAVSVQITGGALTMVDRFDVPGNSTITHTLPWVASVSQNNNTLPATCPVGCCDSSCCPSSDVTAAHSVLATQGAYHILTTQPVSVYQFNPLEFTVDAMCPTNSYSNDASLLLPTSALTGNYLVLAHNAWRTMGSYVTIVGADEGPVTVRVTLSAPITAGPGVVAAAAGTTQSWVLNPGDVVQLVTTAGTSSAFQPQDMTGTVIAANGAVSVIAGVDCTNMSFPNGSVRACDHLEQQLFPVETWSNDVVVSQLRDRGLSERYMVRVMSRENGNVVTFTPPTVHAPVSLNRGTFTEFETDADVLVHSTQPIMVAQFMEGQFTTPGATLGDPAMVLEVPTAQYRRDYNFVVPATYVASYINVVGPAGADIQLDGVGLADTAANAIAMTPWRVWRLPVNPGSHRIESTQAAFGLKVLGVAERTSYAYPGGLDLGTM